MEDTENLVEIINEEIENEYGFFMRPNASPGYWLCTLLPLAFLVSNFRYPICSGNFEYKMVSVATIGILLQSINFFLYIAHSGGLVLRIFYTFLPGIILSILNYFVLQQTISVSIFWGFLVTLIYQYANIKIIQMLPRSFSYGEASLVAQGLVLFLLNACLRIPQYILESPRGHFREMSAIMTTSLFLLFFASWLISSVKICRNMFLLYPLLIVLVLVICTFPITQDLPIITVLKFVFSDMKKVLFAIFNFGLVGVTSAIVSWKTRTIARASTRVRKLFHFLIVLVYVPGLIYQCTFLYIASGVAFAFLTLVEIFRLTETPPLGKLLKESFSLFFDDKDVGYVAVTPFFLLIGCSLPMWISACPCSITDSAVGENLLPMLAGILSIGVGDTAASVIGSKLGRHKYSGSNKTIEGTIAFIVFQALAIYGFYFFDLIILDKIRIFTTALAIVTTAIVEAFTDQIDNIVLPLLFFIIVCL